MKRSYRVTVVGIAAEGRIPYRLLIDEKGGTPEPAKWYPRRDAELILRRPIGPKDRWLIGETFIIELDDDNQQGIKSA